MDRRSKQTTRRSKIINSDIFLNVDTSTTPNGNNDVATPSKRIKVHNPNSSDANISVASSPYFIIKVEPESLADNYDVTSPNVAMEFLDHTINPPVTPRSSRGRGRKSKPVKGNKKTSAFSYGSEEETDTGDEEFPDPMFGSSFPLSLDFETVGDEVPLGTSIIDWNPSVYVDDLDQPLSVSPPSPPSLLKREEDTGKVIYKPTSPFEFNWQKFADRRIQPNSRKEIFTGSKPGPNVQYASPYDAFIDIWDRQIMTHICEQTNLYAQQTTEHLKKTGKIRPQSRVNRWTNVSIDELYIYFAIVLGMGILVKSRIEDYWDTKQDIFITPGFSVYMSFNRFLLINKFLHFNNNEDMQHLELSHSQAKLFKLQPIIEHLNHKFSTLYNLSQEIALDESLMLWNGKSNVNRSMENKAAGVGINTTEICEIHTGYLWRFKAHTGSEPSQNSGPVSDAKSTAVLELIRGLEFKGHNLWMNHRYNSPALARTLKSMQFDCVGTFLTSRKFVPPELSKLHTADMDIGQTVSFTSGDVDLLVRRSNMNRVGLISTYHELATTRCGDIAKPTLVQDYNMCMKGIAKKNRMLAMYRTGRKRTRLWYKQFFRRLLDVSVLNSYIMFKFIKPTMTHIDFHRTLVRLLLGHHHEDVAPFTIQSAKGSIFPKGPLLRNVPVQSAEGSIKLPEELLRHLPAEYIVQEGKSKLRRLCVVCKQRTHTYCPGCNVTLCALRRSASAAHCFRVHHS